ncbi:uncharacterized protein LOC108845561 [Raphanus sativus]|uniref:Uncharacterized protein LOC108845556 n=1 Tax=Raphanus sativus TaxID=3726 RepID=A0A6J0MP51_RAPSA|nr:uncharacterized protein LOC108845556 [Raphanus sativus]XP_018474251.1 uncharacterized protein LOC108845557 [Raphanus sativus]XP_056862443.1 uncharacterized protein LOC108845561 [Raphanus sativus]
MAYRTNFDQTPPFSIAPRQWWSRPMMTIPPSTERDSNCKEMAAMCAPFCGGIFTFVLIILILSFIDKAHLHAKISLQSLAVSSATWQGDFLVKKTELEGNRSDVVSGDLDIKLMAKHKPYMGCDEAGHLNIRCQNVNRGREKIICESSFTDLKLLILRRPQGSWSGGTIGYLD